MTAPQRDNLLHSASRISVLIILAIAAMLLLREIAPRLTEGPTITGESVDAKPDIGGPRYFQAYPGGSSATVRPEEINAQIKRVAAARGISADLVRQLVNAREKTGQDVDVRALNQELDVRWPMK